MSGQGAAQRLGLPFADAGEREVGVGGVPAIRAPLGLAVAHENDLCHPAILLVVLPAPRTDCRAPAPIGVVRLHYRASMTLRWAGGSLEWVARLGIDPYEVLQVLQYNRRWPRQGHTPAGTVPTVWGRTRRG